MGFAFRLAAVHQLKIWGLGGILSEEDGGDVWREKTLLRVLWRIVWGAKARMEGVSWRLEA